MGRNFDERMETLNLIFLLAGTFFLIGTFTIGGGYAMISLLQAQVVTAHGWMTESAFTDIVAISQMTPGPIGINAATYVGYDVLFNATGLHWVGVLGSAISTFALVLPSFIIMLLIVRFYTRFKGSPRYDGLMGWLRPVVVGLIGAAAVILIVRTSWPGLTSDPGYVGTDLAGRHSGSGLARWAPTFTLVRDNFPDWKSWILLAAAFWAAFWRKINPILLIILGALAGLLLY